MGAGSALFDPANMQGSRFELDLVPAQVHEFGSTQAVAVGHEDHGGVAVAPAVLFAAFISRSTSASVRYSRVRRSALGGRSGPDCSVYGGWRDQPEVPFGHALRAPCSEDCSDNDHFSNSASTGRCISPAG